MFNSEKIQEIFVVERLLAKPLTSL